MTRIDADLLVAGNQSAVHSAISRFLRVLRSVAVDAGYAAPTAKVLSPQRFREKPCQISSCARMIRVVIVDDEKPAQERLRLLLDEHSDIEVIGEADNGVSAIETIEALEPDLVFLDIQMPGCDGIEVVSSLSIRPLPKIIFCTAYVQYAVQAFELNALDYLLKPVTRGRLASSIHWALQPAAGVEELHKKLASVVASLKEAGPKLMRRFLGRRARRIHLINEAEILYFKVDRNLVLIAADSGEYWTNYTLAEIENSADPSVFLRTHRQYVVNLNKIKELAPLMGGHYLLTMADGSKVEVSRRRSGQLLEILK